MDIQKKLLEIIQDQGLVEEFKKEQEEEKEIHTDDEIAATEKFRKEVIEDACDILLKYVKEQENGLEGARKIARMPLTLSIAIAISHQTNLDRGLSKLDQAGLESLVLSALRIMEIELRGVKGSILDEEDED